MLHHLMWENKKVKDFPSKNESMQVAAVLSREKSVCKMSVGLEEKGVPSREFSVPPLLR